MNEPIGYHVTCRLEDSRVIAPTPAQRRKVAQIVLKQSSELRLLAFGVPDTHLHLEHVESRATSGKLARRVQTSIRRRFGIPVAWQPAYHKPITHQGHLFKTFDYILRQQPRHELDWDPLHESSNLPDLLGMRVLGQHTAGNVRNFLPRVNRSMLLALLGVPELPEAAGPPEQVVPAVLAALGVNELIPRTKTARIAWRAAMEVLDGQLSTSAIARLLETSPETLFRIRRTPPDRRVVRAIQLQLGARTVIPKASVGAYVAEGD